MAISHRFYCTHNFFSYCRMYGRHPVSFPHSAVSRKKTYCKMSYWLQQGLSHTATGKEACYKLNLKISLFYPPKKSEGYSFGVVRLSILSVGPSAHTFCLSGTIFQYLLVRLDSFLVQMISTMGSCYPISLVIIDPLTLEYLPLFWYRQL